LSEHLYYIPYTAIRPGTAAVAAVEATDEQEGSPAIPAMATHRIFSAINIALDEAISDGMQLVQIAAMINEQDGVLDATPQGFFLLRGAEQALALEALAGDVRQLIIDGYMGGLAAAKSEFAGPKTAEVWADKALSGFSKQAPAEEVQEVEHQPV
jgi:hypothetical protein